MRANVDAEESNVNPYLCGLVDPEGIHEDW
jgi:hypothetical protein